MEYSHGLYFENEEMLKEAVNILNAYGKDLKFKDISSYEAICFEEAKCVIPDGNSYKEFLNNHLEDENNVNKINRDELICKFGSALYSSDSSIVDEEYRSYMLDEVLEEKEKELNSSVNITEN